MSTPPGDPPKHVEEFVDPRSDPDFRPEYYPQANGREAPPVGASSNNDRITLQFLAAYYHLNCAYSRLVEVRRRPPTPERAEAERACLQVIEKRLIVRDHLEDEHASLGVITDPLAQEGFTRNLKISFGNVDAAGLPRNDYYALTAYIPIPLPEGMKLKDVPMRIEGPGFGGDY